MRRAGSISAVSARGARRESRHPLHAGAAAPAHMHTGPAQCVCTGTPEMERMTGIEPVASTVAWSRAASCATSASCEAVIPTSIGVASRQVLKEHPLRPAGHEARSIDRGLGPAAVAPRDGLKNTKARNPCGDRASCELGGCAPTRHPLPVAPDPRSRASGGGRSSTTDASQTEDRPARRRRRRTHTRPAGAACAWRWRDCGSRWFLDASMWILGGACGGRLMQQGRIVKSLHASVK